MSNKQKVFISACLTGQNVKYNGKNNKIPNIEKLRERFELIPFCPEVEGGLPTPRPPSEIVSVKPPKIVNQKGEDVTAFFIKGARKALKICIKEGIKKAILKANSPSCGKNRVYDGTFSSRLIEGEGITAKIFKKNDIDILDESDLEKICY